MSVIEQCANPFRPPYWKWRRAEAILDGPGPATTKRLDTPAGFKWIRQAMRFLTERRASRTDIQDARLATKYRDVYWAHWLWTQSTGHKHSVEAHLLARETDFEVGFRCGIPPSTVAAYEAIFFNVREKLQHPKYILHCVLGDQLHRGLTDADFPLLWKLYGYFSGPHVLDAMEHKFTGTTWCGTPDAVGAVVQDDTIGTMKLKAALAAKSVPVNQHTQLAIMEVFTKFVEIERTTDSAGKTENQLLDHIAAMFGSLPLNVGGVNPKTGKRLPPTVMAPYDQGSVELTYAETMRVSVHRPIPNDSMLRALTFEAARTVPTT